MLAIARTTTPSTALGRIPVSCDGRCQLPLLSRPIQGLSLPLNFLASLAQSLCLWGLGSECYRTKPTISVGRLLTECPTTGSFTRL